MGSNNKYRVSYKRCLLLFSMAYFIPSILFAQSSESVNSKPVNIIPVIPKAKVYRTGDDVFNDVKAGVIIPEGLFGQPLSNPGGNIYDLNSLIKPFKGQDGLGAKTGYTLQFEGFSSLGKPHSSSSVTSHFGLQYGFGFGYVPLNWDNVQWGNYNMTVGTSQFIYGGLKFGPAFYLNPTKDMGIGIYVMVDPDFVIPAQDYATYDNIDASGTKTVTAFYVQDSRAVQSRIDYSAGVNFYYKAFIIGVEYNWVHTKYNGIVTENSSETQTNGTITSPTTNTSFGSVIQTNMLKLTLGIRLGYGGKYRFDGDYKE